MGNNRNPRVRFNCDYCGKEATDRPSHFNRKKRHFCSMQCRADYVREIVPKEEQNRYGTGFNPAEREKRKKARSILNHYLRDKKIKRPSCEVCGSLNTEAHHDDYDRPLDVKWLCFIHHRERHKQLNENPELLKNGI